MAEENLPQGQRRISVPLADACVTEWRGEDEEETEALRGATR